MTESYAERLLDAASKRFDQAEVFEESGESVGVHFDDNRLKEIGTSQFHGVGLRVIHEGRIGFASTTDLRDPARLVEMAAASAEYGDEARFEMPSRPAQVRPDALYDERVMKTPLRRLVEMGREGLEMTLAASDSYLYGCDLSCGVHTRRILNKRGLDFQDTASSMAVGVVVKEVSDNGLLEVYEYRRWGQPLNVVPELTRDVLDKMVLAAKIAPARLEAMPMVFMPKALGNLFGPIGVALNGKLVQKGASVLRGRIGEQVLDERLTFTDDPTVPYAPATGALDDEGTPTRRQHLLDRGVLRTFLTDLQTAALLGVQPSGHGTRGYGSRPGPAPTNLIISAGDASLDDMLRGMKRGIVIEQTLGTGQSNVLAGEFSVNVELGFLVEGGRIVGRVKDCMVAGNCYEVLKRVEAVGSEAQWLGNCCVPPVMVGSLKLAAQG